MTMLVIRRVLRLFGDLNGRISDKLISLIQKIHWSFWSKFWMNLKIKSTIIWDITPCSPLKVNQRFGGTYRIHLQVRTKRWRRYFPPKPRLTFNGPHGVISQKIALFITTAVRTSNLTTWKWCRLSGLNFKITLTYKSLLKNSEDATLHSGLTNSLHGAESFLRSCQLLSYSRNSQHFMEAEGSLPYSQEPSTGSYPEPYQSSTYHPILSH
jgi:hypothetical protein